MANFVVHNSVHVSDLERSAEFYQRAFGFIEAKQIVMADNSVSSFMAMEGDSFLVQLNYSEDMPDVVKTTDRNHLAIETDQFEELYDKHMKMKCVSREANGNKAYFIEDPDGNAIEVLNKYR